MVRIICCHSFLGQRVFSPSHFVQCYYFIDNLLFVFCQEEQVVEVYTTDTEEFSLLQSFPVLSPVVLIRYCPASDLVVTVSRTSADQLSCLVYRSWRSWKQGDATSIAEHDEPLPPAPKFVCVKFSDVRHTSVVRVCPTTGRLAIVDSQSVIVYAFLDDAFHFLYRLDLEVIPTSLELTGDFIIAASVNKVVILEVYTKASNWVPINPLPLAEPSILNLHHIERLSLKEETVTGFQNKLNLECKEILFPNCLFTSQVRGPNSSYLLATWLVSVVRVHGDDKIHSLGLVNLVSGATVAFFSTFKECHMYYIDSQKSCIVKFLNLQYNNAVRSAFIGSDYLLHTISEDLLQTYSTHLLLLLCSDIVHTETDFPNLQIGSQTIFGVQTLTVGHASLFLYSVGDSGSDSKSSTFYKLMLQPVQDVFAEITERALVFKEDSLPIYLHLKLEACLCLLSRASQVSDWTFIEPVFVDCIRNYADKELDYSHHEAVLLKAWNPSIDTLAHFIHQQDIKDDMMANAVIKSYTTLKLISGLLPNTERGWELSSSLLVPSLYNCSQLHVSIARLLLAIPDASMKTLLVNLVQSPDITLDRNHHKFLTFLYEGIDCCCSSLPVQFKFTSDLEPYFQLIVKPSLSSQFLSLLDTFPEIFRKTLWSLKFAVSDLEQMHSSFSVLYLDNILFNDDMFQQVYNVPAALRMYVTRCMSDQLPYFSKPVTSLLQKHAQSQVLNISHFSKFLMSIFHCLSSVSQIKPCVYHSVLRIFLVTLLYNPVLGLDQQGPQEWMKKIDSEIEALYALLLVFLELISAKIPHNSFYQTLLLSCTKHSVLISADCFAAILPVMNLELSDWLNLTQSEKLSASQAVDLLNLGSCVLNQSELTEVIVGLSLKVASQVESQLLIKCTRHRLGHKTYSMYKH